MNEPIRIRCSSLPRLAACPGSFAACANLRSESSDWSASGDRVHNHLQAWALDAPLPDDRLSEREILVYYWFRREVERLLEKHGGAEHLYPEYEFERALPGGRILLTGHIDLLAVCADGTVLVIDYKTLFGEVAPARRNKQLLGYCYDACCAYHGKPVRGYIFSAGNEPGERFTGMALCTADQSAALAEAELLRICYAAVDPDAERIPGVKACRYCPAQATEDCPESRENALRTAQDPSLALTHPPGLPANRSEIRALFEAIRIVRGFEEAFIRRLKAEVAADPEGWSSDFVLKPGGSVRSVEDVEAVYELVVNAFGLCSPAEFRSTLKISVGDLEQLLKPALKELGVRVKDQKEYLAGLLGDLLQTREKAPSLKLVEK